MTMVSDWSANAQVMDLRASLIEEIERQEREDNEKGPEREPEARVRMVSAARPDDARVLDGWFREYGPMVRRVVARSVRIEDADLADDLAQDVWVDAWQHLLRGNEVLKPHGMLAAMARNRARRHYLSDTRPPLPIRPEPHERDGRQEPSPAPARPHSLIGVAA
ncbi:hypothetical protein OIE71_34770 (plasmid) [Streptomyces sp. NBC_01725]|uniref:sigma factor n=1 Tax=Streptomyces sp. NBC_01725 TaxID=2975923 RepID=UPI002E282E98|nr:sigma factor [Streptomyces sp. NBC_01725]